MFDDVMDPNDAGLLELTRRLEAYADARLSPSVAATDTDADERDERGAPTRGPHRRRCHTSRSSPCPRTLPGENGAGRYRVAWHRPAAAFMAASLTLAVLAGTVYGAKAGGPLYGTRLWIEEANLPTGLVARAQAESARLDTTHRRSPAGVRRRGRAGSRSRPRRLFGHRRRGGAGHCGRSDRGRDHRDQHHSSRRGAQPARRDRSGSRSWGHPEGPRLQFQGDPGAERTERAG